ncbi:MAG: PAS domain S-box protein [Chloroflexi bacterium]|nr:PAS domain S-box protein [Chloroflexota bacterium]
MTSAAVPPFLTALAMVALGLLVVVRERGTLVSLSFFGITATVAGWLVAFGWMYCARDEAVALVWAKAAYLSVPLIPATIYQFTVTVLQIAGRRRAFVAIFWVVGLGFVGLIAGTDAVISDLYHYPWGYYPKYSLVGLPYLGVFFALMIASLVEYWRVYRREEPGTRRLRAQWFLVAFSIGYLGSFDYLPVYGIPLYPFGYLPVLVFLGIAARTALRYRLVDITPSFAADQILATVADPLVVCDGDGKIRLVNSGVTAVFGYSESELLGRSVELLAEPDSTHVAALRDAHGGATFRDREMVLRAKDGEAVDVSLSASHLRDRTGRAVGTVLVARDIRERRRAEAELERSLTVLRGTLEATADGILVIGGDGKAITFNRKFARLWRFPEESEASWDGNPRLDWLLSQIEDVDTFLRRIQEMYDWHEPESYDLIRLKDGRTVERYSQLLQIGEEGAGRVSSFRDISERLRAESALRESEERFRELFDEAPVGYQELDADGRIVRVNRTELELLGYEAEEVLGRHVWELFADPEEARREIVTRLRGDGAAPVFELTMRRKDGALVPVLVGSPAHRERNGSGPGFRLTVQDISERKLLEEQFRQSQKMESIGRLAGGIAHDFNNMLTAILGFSELLLVRLPADDPRRNYADLIHQSGERASGLTRQLLAFSRKQVVEPQLLDPNEVVRGLEPLLRRIIGEDVQLLTVLGEDVQRIRADGGQLEQVIMNLAVNARDAMPQGGALNVETATVELDAAALRGRDLQPGAYVMLAVSDTGTGMDAATKARIFEPFFTTKEKGKGTGLGLAMVYGIVEASGGHIDVFSELGLGTTFKLFLPAVPLSEVPAETSEELGDVPRGSETVLLVEDEPVVRNLAAETLVGLGYEVLIAPDGDAALHLAGDHAGRIHLVLTDVVMPGTNGRALADRLASHLPDLRVLYMSGYTDESIARHGIVEPGLSFLQKPFTAERLARKVREVLDAAYWEPDLNPKTAVTSETSADPDQRELVT